MDVSEELEDCADYSDAQFNRHLEKIPGKYQKIQMGAGVARFAADRNYDPESKENKESEKALEACKKYTKPGRHLSYTEALKNIKENGEYVPA